MARSRLRSIALALVACGAIAGGIALTASGSFWPAKTERRADAEAPPQVHVTNVERSNFPITLSGLGTVQAWNQVIVRSRVDGQVERIAFEEGQQVKEGDVLVELDMRPFQAALDQATAKIAQDKANLESASKDLERTTDLSSKGYATKQLFDQQTAAVSQLKALIQADEAAEQNAKVSLGYTTIRAPISGRLGLRTIDIGNIVHATDQNGIVTIAQVEPIAVAFTAPESQLPAIQDGMKHGPLTMTALAPDGTTVLGQGALSAINNSVDIATGTVQLKGKFNNADDKLWPGMSVVTKLVVNTLQNVVTVPDIAVQRGPAGTYAYVANAQSVIEKRDVKIGAIDSGRSVVESGLDSGDRLVISGHYRVQPGSKADVKQDISRRIASEAPGDARSEP